MKLISDYYFYLPQSIILSILATGVFLLVFTIKNKGTTQPLYTVTRVILVLSFIFYLIAYLGIDFTGIIPIRLSITLPSIQWYIVERVILLLLFATLFVFSLKKEALSIMKFTWSLFLVFNIINLLLLSFNYFTWTKPVANNQNPLSDMLESHIYNYTFQRYLLNILIPVLWITASMISLKKFSMNKTGN